eukprot:2172925-Prymnesium_polylepis.1
MSKKRKIPCLSSGSSFTYASISLSNIDASAMRMSGSNPFCVSETISCNTLIVRLERTRVKFGDE